MPPTLDPLSPEAVKSFNRLRGALTEAPILALPRLGLPYYLDTDACEYQIGVALIQLYPDGTRNPVGYWSRSLNNAEKTTASLEKSVSLLSAVARSFAPT